MLVFAIVWPSLSYLVDLGTSWWKASRKAVGLNLTVWGLKILLIVHVIYIIREMHCPGVCIDVREYGEIWVAVLLLFGFTYVPFMLYARYRYFHSMVGSIDQHSDLLLLKGQGKEQLTMQANQVVYLAADDNYVDVFATGHKSEKHTLRATLSDLEAQLEPYPQFVRIHRSFIVNTQFSLKPISKGSLTLLHSDKSIELPVSKSYQPQVDELFIHPK